MRVIAYILGDDCNFYIDYNLLDWFLVNPAIIKYSTSCTAFV